MKRMIRTLALALVATVTFSAAKAQKFQSYTMTQDGNNITITGVVTGLGNLTKFGGAITISFDYHIEGTCSNKNHEIGAFYCDGSASGNFSITPNKNGRYEFSQTIDMTQYLDDAGCKKNFCPNGLVTDAVYTISNLAISSGSTKGK